ncbi:MAG: FkbM family methyltransferase [Verrucomicrobia bacterium]|nr:FkbM family methyltransferase [Verrucomicrobiota bacterium]
MKTLAKNLLWHALRILKGGETVPLRVLGGPAKGAILNLDVRSQASYWLGNYDEYVITRVPFERYLRAGDVAWDCGAFVGFYAAIFRKCVGDTGRVLVIEASQANFRQVARLPELNRWTNVDVRHAAVGPDHSHIEFVGGMGGASGPVGLSPRFATAADVTTEKVQCLGVDELVDEAGAPPPGFIKFDLEGAECSALHNGARVFEQHRPVLMLELHGEAAREAACRFLDRHRYAAVPVHLLDKLSQASPAQWLATLRAKALRSGRALAEWPELPHVMLVFPLEHPELGS